MLEGKTMNANPSQYGQIQAGLQNANIMPKEPGLSDNLLLALKCLNELDVVLAEISDKLEGAVPLLTGTQTQAAPQGVLEVAKCLSAHAANTCGYVRTILGKL